MIVIGLGLWMLTGEIVISGSGSGSATQVENNDVKDASASALASASATNSAESTSISEEETPLFHIKVQDISTQPHRKILFLKGRSGAVSTITHRAETAAIITKIYVEKGQQVKQGDILCSLDIGVREANLKQAETSLEQVELEYKNSQRLFVSGHISQIRLQQLEAKRDAAKAVQINAALEVERTQIKAATSGIISDDIADEGDLLNIGGVCASVVNLNPLLAITQLPEYEVGNIHVGDKANVALITGEKSEGVISYISPAADPQTRTFRTEIKLDNSDLTMRDGVTADIQIKVEDEKAYLIPAIAITLSEKGEIGVKYLDDKNVIHFLPLTLFSQTREGIWARPQREVKNMDKALRIIIIGQDYVLEGEAVDPRSIEIAKE